MTTLTYDQIVFEHPRSALGGKGTARSAAQAWLKELKPGEVRELPADLLPPNRHGRVPTRDRKQSTLHTAATQIGMRIRTRSDGEGIVVARLTQDDANRLPQNSRGAVPRG